MPLPVFLCSTAKSVQGAHPSNTHPAMKRTICSGHVATLAGTERTRWQQAMLGLADVGRQSCTNSVFSVLGQACTKTYLLPKVCIMYPGYVILNLFRTRTCFCSNLCCDMTQQRTDCVLRVTEAQPPISIIPAVPRFFYWDTGSSCGMRAHLHHGQNSVTLLQGKLRN